MKQKLILVLALSFMAKISQSQIIDRFGINMGTSYSTQIWYNKVFPTGLDYYKFGVQAFLQTEKKITNLFALRTEFGYIQKGFNKKIKLNFSGINSGTLDDNVILHDLALNLGLKIQPLKVDYSPYLFVGLRGDYMIAYKDIEFRETPSGPIVNLYKTTIEGYNRFNLGGLIGLGINIKDLIYLEVEYNPSFTKNLDDQNLVIKDDCWGSKIGLNINKLIK